MQQVAGQQVNAKRRNLITMAEYARRISVERSTISRQVKSGIIPTHSGMIDPKEADRCRAERLRPSIAGPRAPARPDPDDGADGRFPPAFYYGIAFFCEQIRDEKNFQALATLARDCGVRSDIQALVVAQSLVYVINAWAGDFFKREVGADEPGPKKFLTDLEAWWKGNGMK